MANVYRARYVSREAAIEFDESGWKKLYGSWFGVKDADGGSSSSSAPPPKGKSSSKQREMKNIDVRL